MSARDRLCVAIRERTTVDTRALAVFRTLLGLLLVADVALRSRNLLQFYADGGAVPRSLARDVAPEYALSIFYLSGDPTVTAVLFVLGGIVGIALAIGYYTRLATILAFGFVVSLDFANPLVLSYADWLYRLLLFWAIFLPLGERWSVDAAHAVSTPRRSVTGLAPTMVLLQVVFVYAMNGLLKAQSSAWPSGEAAVLVFGLDDTTFLLGDSLRAFPQLVAAGGFVWFGLVLFAPLMLLARDRARAAYAGALGLGHLAFALTVRIGAFPYVSIAGLVPFIQPSVADEFAHRFRRFTPQYERGRGMLTEFGMRFPRPTIEALDERTRDLARTTVLRTVVLSFLLFGLLLLPHAGLLASPDGTGEAGFDAALDDSPVASAIHTAHASVGIDQPSWNIFAPEPRSTDRYYVFPARTGDGDVIDALTADELSFDRPMAELHRQHGTYRERFYLTRVADPTVDDAVREAFGTYLCSVAGDVTGQEIVSIEFYLVAETVTPETVDVPADRERQALRFGAVACDGGAIEPVDPPSW